MFQVEDEMKTYEMLRMEMLRMEIIIERKDAEIAKLTEEVEMWRDRWEAERQAHEATIESADAMWTEERR